MKLREAGSDIGTGAIGGYVGTKVMERVSMKLYEMEPEDARQKEDEVRTGPPFVIAARKTVDLLGLDLPEEQIQTLALYGFHYGLGMRLGTDVHVLALVDGPRPDTGQAVNGSGDVDRGGRRDYAPLGLQRS